LQRRTARAQEPGTFADGRNLLTLPSPGQQFTAGEFQGLGLFDMFVDDVAIRDSDSDRPQSHSLRRWDDLLQEALIHLWVTEVGRRGRPGVRRRVDIICCIIWRPAGVVPPAGRQTAFLEDSDGPISVVSGGDSGNLFLAW
jgi:hypothetical protein